MSFVTQGGRPPPHHLLYYRSQTKHLWRFTVTTEENKLAKITVFEQNIDRANFDDKELPTDIHLVEYQVGETLYVDTVRAYKSSDIFDFYYDKITPLGGYIVSITNGYGRVKPKLFTGKGPAQG